MLGSLWKAAKTYIESKNLWVGFLLVVFIPCGLIVLAVNILAKDSKAVNPLDKAIQYYMAGNYERAEQLYKELAGEQPDSIEYHRRYIQTHFSQPKVKGKHNYRDDEHITKYYAGLAGSESLNRRDIGCYGLGLIHSYLAEYEEACTCFAKITNTRLSYYNNSYGHCLLKIGKTEEAEKMFRHEIELQGNIGGAVDNLSYLYLSQHRYDRIAELLSDEKLKEHVPFSVQRASLLWHKEYSFYLNELVKDVFSHITVDGFIAGFIIVVIWFFFFVFIDIFEPEELKYLLLTLALGMTSAFCCHFFYDWFNVSLDFRMTGDWKNDLPYCIAGIGFIEETMKIIPLILVYRYSKLLNEPIDYLIYGGISALGFAFMENLLYFNPAGVSSISGRAFSAVIAHIAMTSLIAYGWMMNNRDAEQTQGKAMIFIWFIAACAVHGLYDFFLSGRGMLESLAPLSFFILVYLVSVYGRMLNNALNISTFFSDEDTKKLHNMGRFLTYSLSYVFLLQYIVVARRYGAENANLSVMRSMIGGLGLIILIIFSLSKFKLSKGTILPLINKRKR
jgi:protease PrsW